MRISPPAARALRLLVSCTLLLAVAAGVDPHGAATVFAHADPPLVAMAIALLFVDRLLAAQRWHLLLAALEPRITYGEVLRLSLIGNFLGVFVPAGSDVVRVYGLARSSSNAALALSSVLVERALAIFTLAVMTLAGLAVWARELPGAVALLAALCLAGILLAAAALMHPEVRRLLLRLLDRSAPRRLHEQAARLFGALDAYRDRPRLLALGVAASLAFQVFRVFNAQLGLWAFGIDVAFLELLTLMPVAFVLTLLPVSLAGGLGVREASFVWLLGLLGVPAEAAFAAALMLSLGGMLTLLPGAWMYARAGVAAG